MDLPLEYQGIAIISTLLFLVNVFRIATPFKPEEYQDIDDQHPIARENTWLEVAIIFLNFAIISCNIMSLILCFVTGDFGLPPLLYILYFYHSISALSFGMQIYLMQRISSSRYYFTQASLAISAQIMLLKNVQDADSLYILISQISLGIMITFTVLELFKPSKDAHLINANRDTGRAPSLEETASPYSLITFSWVNPLLDAGYRKSLESEDLNHLSRKDKMKNIAREWTAFRNRKNSIVWDATLFTKQFAIYQILVSVITTTLDFAKPFFINLLLVWIQNRKPNDPYDFGFYLLIGMFASSILKQILDAQVYLSGRHWGMQLRAIFVYEIFKKSLRRTGGAALMDDEQGQKATQGKIVSLMSTDTNSIRWFLTDIHSILIDIPLSIAISISGLLYVMGTPALAGLVVIIISGPISSWAMTRLYKILKDVRSFVDKRIQVTNEALLGIRIIKYMSWESQFVKKIWQARENELNSRLKLLMSNLLVTLIAWGSSIMVTFTSFFFYTIVAGNKLDAATAFTSISLLSTLSFTLNDITQQISSILNIRVTMGRINSFLREDDLDKFSEERHFKENRQKDVWIGFKNGEFGYYGSSSPDSNTSQEADHDAKSFKLQNISIVFPHGKLTAIIGPTGAGKSSILLTLLGEMKNINGLYSIPEHHLLPNSFDEKSDIVYVPQTPWLQNATIKENILFGEAFDEKRYLNVVKACALLRDLDALEYGDMTEVGEKGVNLSGGQKQRLSLARAAYSKAPIVLLDDPLSAVDAPTARHLMKNCILGLFSGRTVLLVTHAVYLVLPKADHVVVVKNGRVFKQGTYDAVLKDKEVTEIVELEAKEESDASGVSGEVEFEIALKSQEPPDNREGKATGTVKWEVYKSYLIACGGIFFIIGVFLSFSIQVAADFLSNWWIEVWTDSLKHKLQSLIFLKPMILARELFAKLLLSRRYQSELSSSPNILDVATPEEQKDALYYITIFGLISFVELFALLFKYCIQFFGGIRASRIMHTKLSEAVFGSPMRFFETTPVGRIINRFSKDLSDIDLTVMFTVMSFGTIVLGAIVRILLVSFVTPPFTISILFVFLYWRIAKYYLASSREIKRIESVSNSPIYALFGEVLNGASTIRAYGAEPQFIHSIMKKVDANHRAFFYLFATNRWLTFRTSVLSSFIVFVAGVSIIITKLPAGWAGLAFNFASQITNMINRAIMTHSSLEMAMNAVERVEEYSKLPQEPYVGELALPENWPTAGQVEVSELSVRYAPDLPLVLKGISFRTDGNEKVGIVGRTGAGKSTLSLAFFRIVPFLSGTIFIDGIDISKLGVGDLRSRLTIIPQDPVLFEGSLRSNLDPLEVNTDEEIWQALKLTHVLESLKDINDNSTTISLDYAVNENGSNFSQGQRQLICLARALLKSSKFIFLDEATASVDPETDSKIQETVRKEFSTGTILTVAHRLKTVIDYDRILVLDQGKIGEIGTPLELLKKKGMFYSMCVESGDYEELYSIASKTALTK